MEVILLERVGRLGQMGDVVRVKDGFARNFLLPKGKALRATKDNRSRFETMKIDLEARNLEQRGEAEKVGKKLDGQNFTVLRQAAEGGQLYGSVSPRDIAALVVEGGFAIDREQITLNAPIKNIGMHKVPIALHPEVEVTINVAVARNADEAARLARGENVTVVRTDEEEAKAEALANAEKFFDPEAPGSAGRRNRRPGRGREVGSYSSNGSSWGTVAASTRVSVGASGCGSDFASSGRLPFGACCCACWAAFGRSCCGRSCACCCAFALSLSWGALAFSFPARGSAAAGIPAR